MLGKWLLPLLSIGSSSLIVGQRQPIVADTLPLR